MDADQFEAAEKGPVTFAILTTKANEVMQSIHDRMPVILPLGKEKNWLAPGGLTFFPPFPAELKTRYPVTPKMNRAARSHCCSFDRSDSRSSDRPGAIADVFDARCYLNALAFALSFFSPQA